MSKRSKHIFPARVAASSVCQGLIVLLVGTLSVPDASAQARRGDGLGFPYYMEHYTPEEYQAHPQNWAITQDQRGVVYVGNYEGLLEYDGVSWRIIPTSSNTTVRSLDVGSDGRVYVGVQGDFGYLAPDSLRRMRYVSLMNEIGSLDRDFADVWSTHASEDGVYFQSSNRLFRWNGDTLNVWRSSSRFHTSFLVHGELFVREDGVGLEKMEGDQLKLLPGGELFADQRVYAMLPYTEEEILIGSRDAGFFLFDGAAFHPFPTQIDTYLETYRLYHAASLSGGYFIFATLGGGAVVMDKQGRAVQFLNEETGMPDDWVNYLFPDRQGGVWLALNNRGVVRADIPSQLTQLDERVGLEGMVQDLEHFENKLFVASGAGVHVLDTADNEESAPIATRFSQLIQAQSWALLAVDNHLLVATDDGVISLHGSSVIGITASKAFCLHKSSRREGVIYVGLKDGLGILRRTTEGWEERSEPILLNEEVRAIVEDKDGTVWVRTRNHRLLRLHFSHGLDVLPVVEAIPVPPDVAQGEAWLHRVNGEVALVARDGIYRFNVPTNPVEAAGRSWIYRDPLLNGADPTGKDTLLAFHQARDERLWMVYQDRVVVATPRADGSYVYLTPKVLQFPDWFFSQLHVQENGVAWISNGNLLVRYDPNLVVSKKYDVPYTVLIRGVSTLGTERVLFGGALSGTEGQLEDGLSAFPIPVLTHAENALRIEFAAPSYNGEGENLFQFFLEGHDENWSAWTNETHKDYTNLYEGRYRFHVRAVNGQGVVSSEAVYVFRLLPPWWRTWWAYSLYTLAVLAFLSFSVRYRRIMKENERAQEQARELARERILNERLQQVNARLQEANESLTQADKLKDEFIANTSHELRTPLAAILGSTAILKEEVPAEHHEFLQFIEENGNRLLYTLDALLELARLRAGMVEVQEEPLDVRYLVRDAIAQFKPLADKKNLPLEVCLPDEPAIGMLDVPVMERILGNLIGNAIKFTDEGQVHVSVVADASSILVEVRDTGLGIEEDFLPYLFDEFKQESTGLTRSYEGSGLGLAITGRLVELLQGRIEVSSEKGKGSVFTVVFPAVSSSTLSKSPADCELVETSPEE